MIEFFKKVVRKLWGKVYKNYGHKDRSARISNNVVIYKPENLYMYEHTGIGFDSVIMNWRAKFIMKKYSAAAFTDNEKQQLDSNNEFDKDVIVEEDVWMGSNVTLLGGSHVGRGCNIGSGSVVRGNIPPYAVVYGNPAKVVGFAYTPQEIVEHELSLYPEEERIPLETLEKNYKKYFLNRLKDIKNFTHL